MSEVEFVLYTADWCVPCKKFKQTILPQLEENYTDVTFRIVDIDDPPEYEDISFVSSVPLVVITKGSKSKKFTSVLRDVDKIEATLDKWCGN